MPAQGGCTWPSHVAKTEGIDGGGKVTDDKFLKSILESQKALRSHRETVAAFEAITSPKLAALQIYDENSAVRQMMKDLERKEASMRLAWGPMWRDNLEMASKRFSDISASFIRSAEEARQAVAVFETRFRLPEIPEIGRLIAEYKTSPISEALAAHAEQAKKLQQAMESMRTPWLDAQKSMSSIAGFAELQGIGNALRSVHAFDENLTASLRINLGDWRDSITWSPGIFTDLSKRSKFYADLGFNHALTDFPMPAFEQGLDLAGLRPDPPPFVDRYRLPVPPPSDEEEEDEGFSRTNMAHDRLLRMETQLRAFIDGCMTQMFGADWPKHRLPTGLYEQWQAKKGEAQKDFGAIEK
jgi:hypothetical protein